MNMIHIQQVGGWMQKLYLCFYNKYVLFETKKLYL